MTTYALGNDLTPIDLPLSSIYLDPNNPRFVGPTWSYIPEEDIDSETIQEETRRRLISGFGIEKLRMNMEVNGYLPIDRVIVREFKQSKYVVLEGNRRICAAKLISKIGFDGSDVHPDILASLKSIPCLQYTGSAKDAAWIFQGLRHITGISDWSSFNKAKLLVEQMENEEISLTEVGKRFGLTSFGAGQWVRGYYAFKQAREHSDFISEVDERSYPYFQELFSRSSAAVREWIEWNDTERHFENNLNFNEFVSWLYPRPLEDELEHGMEIKGDWERRIIRRQDDVRQIAYLVREDKDAFEQFRRELDLERAYSLAISKKYANEARESYDAALEVFKAIDNCKKVLDNIPYKIFLDPALKERLFNEFDILETLIKSLR